MVIKIAGTIPCSATSPHPDRGELFRKMSHTGQDPVIHGRSTKSSDSRRIKSNESESIRESELVMIESIDIDENLLTGDLDRDISILNIVA